MVEEKIEIGLVIERIDPQSEWASPHWRPALALPGAPDTPPWTVIAEGADRRRYYAGAFVLHLYSTETANYAANLAAGPKLWVVLRPAGAEPPVEVAAVTADPAEGEAFTEPGHDIVETISMPAPVAAALADFVERHHVERPFLKRRRDSAEMDVIDGAQAAKRGPDDAP